jgi:hypothetical protein
MNVHPRNFGVYDLVGLRMRRRPTEKLRPETLGDVGCHPGILPRALGYDRVESITAGKINFTGGDIMKRDRQATRKGYKKARLAVKQREEDA